MKAFRKHRGIVAPLDRPNIDTDAIIPKQFLKRVERTGFGQFLFFDWRFHDDGSENEDFVLNRPQFRESSVLLGRDNFGCGSSREHAPWALEDYGFRVLLAPSFADIFYNNCFQNGILPVRLDSAVIDDLFDRVASHAGYELEADLESCRIRDDFGLELAFEISPFRRDRLLNGWDDIGLTLLKDSKIAAFEDRVASPRP